MSLFLVKLAAAIADAAAVLCSSSTLFLSLRASLSKSFFSVSSSMDAPSRRADTPSEIDA